MKEEFFPLKLSGGEPFMECSPWCYFRNHRSTSFPANSFQENFPLMIMAKRKCIHPQKLEKLKSQTQYQYQFVKTPFPCSNKDMSLFSFLSISPQFALQSSPKPLKSGHTWGRDLGDHFACFRHGFENIFGLFVNFWQ